LNIKTIKQQLYRDTETPFAVEWAQRTHPDCKIEISSAVKEDPEYYVQYMSLTKEVQNG